MGSYVVDQAMSESIRRADANSSARAKPVGCELERRDAGRKAPGTLN